MKKGTKITLGVIGVLIIGGIAANNNDKNAEKNEKTISVSENNITTQAVENVTTKLQTTVEEKTTQTEKTTAIEETTEKKTEPPTKKPTELPTEPPQPKETLSQKNAVSAAKNYIDIMAFSYTGLIKQLEFEKYPHEDAVYGADNCGADWFEEAAEAAKSYMDIMPMSRDELKNQLEFEGFTPEQAEHGVQTVGY